jgi:ABC-type molybdenum transport system ATPase subunit/photorepair protein PhrA
VITHNGTASKSANDMSQLVAWIFGSEADEALLKNCPFTELSQGQQKLVLFASAVATRPKVLLMDEPTQGLDWVHRCRVLSFLERLCLATDTSLVFITHYQEEWIPSISHVLHLNKGRVLYQGPKHGYNPAKLNNKIDEDEDADWM